MSGDYPGKEAFPDKNWADLSSSQSNACSDSDYAPASSEDLIDSQVT